MSLQTMWQQLREATLWDRLGVKLGQQPEPVPPQPISYPTEYEGGHIRAGTGYRPAAADLQIPRSPPTISASEIKSGAISASQVTVGTPPRPIYAADVKAGGIDGRIAAPAGPLPPAGLTAADIRHGPPV